MVAHTHIAPVGHHILQSDGSVAGCVSEVTNSNGKKHGPVTLGNPLVFYLQTKPCFLCEKCGKPLAPAETWCYGGDLIQASQAPRKKHITSHCQLESVLRHLDIKNWQIWPGNIATCQYLQTWSHLIPLHLTTLWGSKWHSKSDTMPAEPFQRSQHIGKQKHTIG